MYHCTSKWQWRPPPQHPCRGWREYCRATKGADGPDREPLRIRRCRGAQADPCWQDVSEDARVSGFAVHRQGGRHPCRGGEAGLSPRRFRRRQSFSCHSTSTRWSMSPSRKCPGTCGEDNRIPRFADRGERFVEIPEIQIVEGKTSARLGTALVRPLVQTEIVEVVEIAAPLPAESASPIFFRHLPDVSEDARDSTVAVHRQVVQVPQVQVVEKTIEIPRFADRGEHR